MSQLKPDVDRSLRELIRTALGMPANSVRPANQAAPTLSQSDAFATVQVTALQPTGWDSSSLKNEASSSHNVKETLQGMRLISVSVQFFRGDAYAKALRLGVRLQMQRQIAKMQAVGLGLVRMGSATDMTAVIDSDWEARAHIGMEFHIIAQESDSLPTFAIFPLAVLGEESGKQPSTTAVVGGVEAP